MSGLLQSSISARPDVAVLGQLVETMNGRKVNSKVARGRVKAGYGVFAVPTVGTAGTDMLDPGEVFHLPDPVIAVDVDAIITAYTTSTAIQTFSGTALNGAVGGTEMQPARKVTVTTSSHADWSATNITVTGVNHLGQVVTDTLASADAGNETLTTTSFFRTVTSVVFAAQGGTGGTATVGISVLTATPAITAFRGVAIRQPMKTTIASNGLYGYPGITSQTVTADYVDGEPCPCLTAGGIWVYSEEAIADGDPVYCRVVAGAGGSVLGAFRNDADTASAILIPGAVFCRDTTAAGPAWASLPHYFGA